MTKRRLLHVGCGPTTIVDTPFAPYVDAWDETRMDLDESVQPDLVGSMADLQTMSLQKFDAIYSSHSIEHLYAHDVPVALAGFRHVLSDTGFALITCPDLQSVCALVAEGNLKGVAYTSPVGPIAPVDILYGHRPAMAEGRLFMAHRYGFTQQTLNEELVAAGFGSIAVARRPDHFDLWAIAFKTKVSRAAADEAIAKFFPK